MVSVERSKKKLQPWKRAIVHFLLCFVMGFFTGFAPMGKSSIFSTSRDLTPHKSEFSPESVELLHGPTPLKHSNNVNRSLIAERPAMPVQENSNKPERLKYTEKQELEEEENLKLIPRKLVIIVTPTNTKNKHEEVLLRKMANTISLVPPPLVWIVVEKKSKSEKFSRMLRKTSIMYRHLVYTENFSNHEAELDHQRNLALRHIEYHKLSGIVHFAGLSNVYDLDFFHELREIEDFGAWPMAILSANRKKFRIEGPVCDSSQVIGWHLRKKNTGIEPRNSIVPISSFAFNSSILWDPERWGRASSVPDTSQKSVNFVKQEVLEDEAKVKGIPSQECSKILLWHLKFPTRAGSASNNHPEQERT